MKSGCRELPNRPEQVGVEGFPAAGGQSFDSPLGSTVVSRNNRRPKPRGPGLVRGKVSTCCARWWQWHWQWCKDNVAASSCVGGDSGVRREVEFWGAPLTNVLDWSVWVKGPDLLCAPALICAAENCVRIKKCVFRFERRLWDLISVCVCVCVCRQSFGIMWFVVKTYLYRYVTGSAAVLLIAQRSKGSFDTALMAPADAIKPTWVQLHMSASY